ncbi:hypothetical protein Kpol_1065p41 [Vanderwaltozyma polyspora DSM 70294]|uniref:TEA domain-containing protein n=1 Tax=Vanderwaltozyma polyspora (strain ATCC 22028 / DSM 70294 / BCRC 21397 / CBS 2163 / NBRC 10782 / NRRL Y-8283 / UCD 57-17) TaxID=436907 RepID=A7TL62_VANPO|nr:uncharacterized protein Kpol_1065p41 [Vanderwaltozyma polyspora DSM 70294]EDO17025.1 hypothetical protein Kpol_1065p41 [Vanderwaltozyma polyspora DSM 70294]
MSVTAKIQSQISYPDHSGMNLTDRINQKRSSASALDENVNLQQLNHSTQSHYEDPATSTYLRHTKKLRLTNNISNQQLPILDIGNRSSNTSPYLNNKNSMKSIIDDQQNYTTSHHPKGGMAIPPTTTPPTTITPTGTNPPNSAPCMIGMHSVSNDTSAHINSLSVPHQPIPIQATSVSKSPILREVCDKWSHEVETAFINALRLILKNGTYKIKLLDKNYGRNELISIYIQYKTGEVRTKKQISSHIQVWKKAILNKMANGVPLSELEKEVLRLIEHGVQQNEHTVKLFYSVFEGIIDPWSKQSDDLKVSKSTNINNITGINGQPTQPQSHPISISNSAYMFNRNDSISSVTSTANDIGPNRASIASVATTARTSVASVGKLPSLPGQMYHNNVLYSPHHENSYGTNPYVTNSKNPNPSVVSAVEDPINENRRVSMFNSMYQNQGNHEVNPIYHNPYYVNQGNINTASSTVATQATASTSTNTINSGSINGNAVTPVNAQTAPGQPTSINQSNQNTSEMNGSSYNQLKLPPVSSIPSFRSSFTHPSTAPIVLLRQSSQSNTNATTPSQSPPKNGPVTSLPPPQNIIYSNDGMYSKAYVQDKPQPQQYQPVVMAQAPYPVRSPSLNQTYNEQNVILSQSKSHVQYVQQPVTQQGIPIQQVVGSQVHAYPQPEYVPRYK